MSKIAHSTALCSGQYLDTAPLTQNGTLNDFLSNFCVEKTIKDGEKIVKVMVVGGGGREHAIIKKIKENKEVEEIFALPGNGGMAKDATLVDIVAKDIDKIVEFAVANGIDYAVVAPDDPLVLGCVDALEEKGIPCFGPKGNAAIIEGSKVFSKNLMKKYGIPTAAYEVFNDMEKAMEYLETAPIPTVIKADGLALGKGVIIANTREEAKAAVVSMMQDKMFGTSGDNIVIEEFLTGPEVSVLSFTDGKTVVPMISSMDHKRAGDNDTGLNTGGMGTIAPNPYYTKEIAEECMEKIFLPTIDAMNKEGRTFKGCLYFGLMITPNGPKVIEYNCRFGDPETQVVLPLLESDLLTIMKATTNGTLADTEVKFSEKSACCVIMASKGYPVSYEKGFEIRLPEDDKLIFIAGAKEADGKYVHYASPIQVGSEQWWVKTSLPEAEYNATVTSIRMISLVLAVVSVVVICALVMAVLRKMLNPLTELEKSANYMAAGSLHVNLDYESEDEIGSLAACMRTMMERVRNIIDDLGYTLDEMANANFAVELKNKNMYIGDYRPLAVALENIVQKLNHALVNIKVASEQVNSGADQVASAAQALSQGATEQASTVEELSAAMEEISNETKRTAQKSGEANDVADLMRTEVMKSNSKMEEMSEAMQDITNKSNEIEKIIKTIDDIAFQTNILALNAAVEAARAGAAGKGFAVVADEVRNLAAKSAEASKNTADLIGGTVDAVNRGSAVVSETAETLFQIVEGTKTVSGLVADITEDAQREAVALRQVRDGIEQIARVVHMNSASSEESASASVELSTQAIMMKELMQQFTLRR